jgi:hypothetical protein
MSFRDIGAITNRYKEKIERENGQLEDKNDIKSKSKTTQAIKMFSEGQIPPQVLIELDLPPENVRTIHRQYLETMDMYDFLQVYDQFKNSDRYYISSLLRLYRIIEDLGMGEQQIINVLNLANHNQLERLQWKVEYIANEVNALEEETTNCEKHLTLLNMRRDESMQSLWALEMSLAQKREELAYMNQQPRLPVINEPTYTKEDDNIYPPTKHIEMRRRRTSFLSVTRSDDHIY